MAAESQVPPQAGRMAPNWTTSGTKATTVSVG